MKTHKTGRQSSTVLYLVGVALLFAGIASFPLADAYSFVSIALIVLGCVTFVFIPIRRKQ